ncbi:hypothetical protein [Herbaspirillum autotrophicum]|nr:hypothetical protein [Herbaspirillum autotrophicum]
MRQITRLLAYAALAYTLTACACVPGFIGFDSRCGFTNVPSGQP